MGDIHAASALWTLTAVLTSGMFMISQNSCRSWAWMERARLEGGGYVVACSGGDTPPKLSMLQLRPGDDKAISRFISCREKCPHLLRVQRPISLLHKRDSSIGSTSFHSCILNVLALGCRSNWLGGLSLATCTAVPDGNMKALVDELHVPPTTIPPPPLAFVRRCSGSRRCLSVYGFRECRDYPGLISREGWGGEQDRSSPKEPSA